MKFNSQICTSREQSERLLALGLKKETADMVLVPSSRHDGSDVIRVRKSYLMEEDAIPAWSLHRMWEFICNRKKYESKEGDEYPKIYLNDDCVIVENPKSIWASHNFCSLRGVYENVINCIEWLIKEGYFNKEYLQEQADSSREE